MDTFWNGLLLADGATDLLSNLDPEQRTWIVIIAIACITGVILGLAGIIYSAFDSAHRRRMEIGLKREMIERGMSAEEIAKVIECAPPLEDATSRWIASWAEKNRKKTG
jgi:hypothetical protein